MPFAKRHLIKQYDSHTTYRYTEDKLLNTTVEFGFDDSDFFK